MISLKRISWIYPDRNTEYLRQFENDAIWDNYKKIAREIGVELTLNKPDDVMLYQGKDKSEAYIKGVKVTPDDTLFITTLWTLPHQVVDTTNQVALYSALESFGFYLPIKPQLSYICADKLSALAYLRQCPINFIPTVKIQPGRDEPMKYYKEILKNLSYPILLKPAYWGMGIGVTLIKDDEDLHSVLGLLRGSETSVVLQPYLGHGLCDFRVYTVNKRVATVVKRIPANEKSRTANLTSGGHGEYIDLPSELTEAVAFVLEKVPLDYLCIDFIYDGKQFWLSELEPDGAVTKPATEEIARLQHDVILSRFTTYKKAHAEHMGDRK